VNEITKCDKCGSTDLNDLGASRWKYQTQSAVICNKCNAHWWKKWYTRAEWEAYINAPDVIPSGLPLAEYLKAMDVENEKHNEAVRAARAGNPV
jgi:ribosomal protein L40E